MRMFLLVISAAAFVGCGSKAATKVAKPDPRLAVADSPGASAVIEPIPTARGPNVTVESDLATRCQLELGRIETAPKFAYDDSELQPADRALLEQVARCLITGPLEGERVQLVGRADPRGTEEYNLGLGTRRADTVRSYLYRLGVSADQLIATTRGELDATGVDEAGWQRDRRVDLRLVN